MSSRSNNYNTTVYITTRDNIYQYKKLNLILAYGIAFTVTFVCVILGLRAILVNGVVHGNDFSTILSTTRYPAFDALTLGSSLGTKPTTQSILETKVRLGLLRTESEQPNDEYLDNENQRMSRVSFGEKGTMHALKKGQICQ